MRSVLLLLSAVPAHALLARSTGATGRETQDLAKNPIRKVVTLLQKMAQKVQREADEEKALYDKFACYCKTEGNELQITIGDSTAKVPQLQSDIEQSVSTVARLKVELKQHQEDRAAANVAVAEATRLREKEHAEYASEAAELGGYVTALSKAIPALESGMSGAALLQSAAQAAQLRRAANRDEQLTEDDRQSVLSFLEGRSLEADGYIPQGGEIVGMLKTMREDFAKSLARIEETEKQALALFDELVAAKKKEIETHGASIEKKTARLGELGVEIAGMRNELTDTEAALIEDQKLLQQIGQDCESKQKEFAVRVQTRGEELTAIYETIKILNDDDALELFKKSLPGGSFLQFESNEQQLRQRVLVALARGRAAENAKESLVELPDLRFLEVALAGSRIDFSKVIKMIDNMLAILKQEQLDDDHKLEYCRRALDTAEDKLKVLEGHAEDLEVSIEDEKNAIATFKDEIKTLQAGVKDLDKSVMEITEQRKNENEEFSELMSTNTAAKELLEFAKNRLNKFYNPKLYKAPPKRALTEEERIFTNHGGELEPTAAPGGIAGTGIEAPSFLEVSALGHDEPAAPPKTWEGDYSKKHEQSSGVIAMIDLLIRELSKEMTEGETQEKIAQEEYEGLMDSSAKKRAKDTKLIAIKTASKADTEEMLITKEGTLDSTHKELMATKSYEGQLHVECDWLMQYYDLRKTAREEESENLRSAKAVLSGADFSLLQARK